MVGFLKLSSCGRWENFALEENKYSHFTRSVDRGCEISEDVNCEFACGSKLMGTP